MALCHIPSFFSPTPKSIPKWAALPYLLLGPPVSCSAEKASKKGRSSKQTKSNEQLRIELRQFILAVELPDDHVPTMKELSEHGRKDLANIVRRRGYKVIAELLRASKKSDSYAAEPPGDQGSSDACIDEVTDGSSLEVTFKIGENGAVATDCSDQSSEPSELSIGTLQIKAANFIQTGELDLLEDASEVDKVNEVTDSERESGILSINGADNAYPTSELVSTLSEDHPDGDMVTSGDRLCGADLDECMFTEMVSEVDSQAEIDHLKAILHQKEMELSELKQEVEKEKVFRELGAHHRDRAKTEDTALNKAKWKKRILTRDPKLWNNGFVVVVYSIDRKQGLCILQARANTEIGNARREITEKDAEFQATEESLSGLKEVQIDYWGNGETVEVAGSFNGWHHRIKMDLDPSNNLINSPVSRNSKLWSTILWLYPGVYEIKFIVDGDWRIDPNLETSSNGYITNNVLRVDR